MSRSLPRVLLARKSGGSAELNEVPTVPEGILPDGHGTIWFVARGFFKCDAFGHHGGVIACEIIGRQKQTNAATELIADGSLLPGSVGTGKDQSALRRTRRQDTDPSFVALIDILCQLPAERAAIKRNCSVVIGNKQGDRMEGLNWASVP